MELIQNLYANYARISATDMLSNDECLRSPYNVKELLEFLIERLDE